VLLGQKIKIMTKKLKGNEDLPFGKILRSIMQERNLTLKQVADLASVSLSTVQNWSEGKTPHDLKAVARLAQTLGVSFKALLIGEVESHGSSGGITELFEEQDWFDGHCKIIIKRLIPRKGKP
jgi:transcriptional regulator with XRE-family HTH domain